MANSNFWQILFFLGKRFRHLLALNIIQLLLLSMPVLAIDDLELTVDDIITPAVSIKAIKLKWLSTGAFIVDIGHLITSQYNADNISITCKTLDLANGNIRCPSGKLRTTEMVADTSFFYSPATKRFDLTLIPKRGEQWRIAGQLKQNEWQAQLTVNHGQLIRLVPFMSAAYPKISKGEVTGNIEFTGNKISITHVNGEAKITDLAFSDTAGLHAAEKLEATLKFKGERINKALDWRASLRWNAGEVFWAPLYFASAGHSLEASGVMHDDVVQIQEGLLKLSGVGDCRFSALWNFQSGLESLNLATTNLDANGFYTVLLKPFLEKTAFNQLSAKGQLNAAIVYADNVLQRVDIGLDGLTLVDSQSRFTLEALSGTIPWRHDQETYADVRLGAAKLLGIPIGEFTVPIKMRGFDFLVDQITVPVLDGKLLVKDLRANEKNGNWQWQFNGVVLPISMEAITKAANLPIMRGVLSATIPQVAYADGRVRVDGGIGIRVFDGDIAITDLTLEDPLSNTPRLNADIEMRNLDLSLITSTFKFGSMEGRIDTDVKSLELSNWKPVKFDARIASTPGSYRKRISQQAVQNISALGGAGAAAAIQRSVLRFFEEFGYQQIGLSCRLRNGVCDMAGVESAPQGYVIVKGGGIPAITVKGYNRSVGWNELLERLSLVIQGNLQPVIQ